MNTKLLLAAAAIALCGVTSTGAQAQTLTISDNFTGASSSYNWQSFNGACLTAGNNTGTIPACVGLAYYGSQVQTGGNNGWLGSSSAPSSASAELPDPVGNGALRFTNNADSESGAIVSNFTYPSNQGLQVTFTTVTYQGDSGGAAKDGADGMSFFLMNGNDPPDLGAWGGSLGYTCSNTNTPYKGINGGYIGLGIDEYGNFLNGTNLMPGYSGSNSATGDNTAWGYGYHPGRIGLRGAGNITWGVLNAAYGTNPNSSALPYYPAALATACTTGVFIGSQPAPNQCATGCSAGAYVTATNTCDTCSTGTWVASTTSCNTCSAGTFVSSSDTCNTCPNGENYITASNVCAFCSSGVYYNQKCYSCSSGVVNSGSPPNCIDICASGYVYESTANTPECYSCKVGGTLTPGDLINTAGVMSCSSGTLKTAASTTASATSVAASTSTPTQNAPTLNAPVQGPPTYGATTDLRPTAVQNTCKTGQLWNYTSATAPTSAGTTMLSNAANTASVLDYYPIPNAYEELPSGVQIANESATKRSQGVPITYKLKITSAGLLSFWYSYNGGAYQSVITNQNITAANGPLPANFRFGFGGSTGGSRNIHEIMCFQAVPADTSASSAGLNEKESAKVQTGTQVYFAFYNPNTWAGSLTSNNLLVDAFGNVSIATTSNWDASCVLTGVAAGSTCLATGLGGPTPAEAPGSRQILTWGGSSGIAFEWSSVTSAQQTVLNVGDATSGTPDRLNFLRGDRTNELNTAGVGEFRDRTSVLADIVDSSPTWVGPPQGPYSDSWTDLLNASNPTPENSGQPYSQFVANFQSRLNVVYSGANDGLMHGFRSGAYSNATTYNGTLNDGLEVLAYMPGSTITGVPVTNGSGTQVNTADTIHGTDPTNSNAVTSALDYSNAQYGHNFYADATPGTGDVFINGTWHTWLVSGLGPGGAVLFALDITDPTQFSEGNAPNLVMGEWNASTLTCANNASCGQNLGQTYGVPQIRRFHNGMWGAVLGNGFNSITGDAGIYVMTIDPNSGNITFYYLSANMTGTNDGIAYTTPADLDGDHIVDYVYAGDVLGNVWKFDLTSSNPSNWTVTGGPLFSTPAGQPITTKLVVASVPSSTGPARIMVEFGTGQKIPLTNFTNTQFATGTQYLYGIWDWNVSAWNAMSSTQYAGLTGTYTITTANLVTQVATDLAGGYRTVTNNPVCWYNPGGTAPPAGSTGCTSYNQFGWMLALPDSSPGATSSSPVQPEQVVYSPILAQGAFIVNTTIPAAVSATGCTSVLASGWTMAISPSNGGAFPTSFFANSTGNFVTQNNKVISGVQLAGTGSPTVVVTDTSNAGANSAGTFLVTQTVSGTGAVVKINPPAGTKGGRVTWIERR